MKKEKKQEIYVGWLLDVDSLERSMLIGAYSSREKLQEAIDRLSEEMGELTENDDYEVDEMFMDCDCF